MENYKKIKIKQINIIPNLDVYDITVEKNHNFFANSILVHNCGEIYMQNDTCRLIHINLTSFVKDGKLDEENLYKVSYETMRLADDLVDLEEKAVNRILDKICNDGDEGNSEYNLYTRILSRTLEGRRCGLGFLGLADTIALLGYKYDSDESLKMISHIMRLMFTAEMDCEIDMAITRGAFPAYNKEYEEKGNLWYNTLKKDMPQLYDKMMKFGRRNISWNTVAPTGTVGLMALTSTGIEPIFMPYYTRRVKCMKPSDRVDFVDNVGEKYTEYVTVHPGLLKWANENNLVEDDMNVKKWQKVYESSPWYKSTANDIDWKKRVKLQGLVLQAVTHSISSCITRDMLIETDNGYYYLDEIFDINDINENEFKNNSTFNNHVVSHDGSYNNIKSFYNNGVKDVFKLTLLNGLTINCTSNEKFLIFDETSDNFYWTELNDINEGDKIKIK